MGVFLFLFRGAYDLCRRDRFCRELLGHRLFVALTRIGNQPAHRQCSATLGAYFDRNLVRRTADAAALDLDNRLEVGQRLLEDVDARLAGAGFDEIHRPAEDSLGDGLLPLVHEGADELGDGLAIVARVREHRTADSLLAATHFFPPVPALGLLVPYVERLGLRPETPAASSGPRRM